VLLSYACVHNKLSFANLSVCEELMFVLGRFPQVAVSIALLVNKKVLLAALF